VEEILRRDGRIVELASGGREALRLLEDRAFDLVISDLRMPDGDGRELHRELAFRNPGLAGRMLFLTGDTLGVTATELTDVDRDALIEKPVAPAALCRVRRRLDEARDQGGTAPPSSSPPEHFHAERGSAASSRPAAGRHEEGLERVQPD
jgi:CheY-like chemotaxis protein